MLQKELRKWEKLKNNMSKDVNDKISSIMNHTYNYNSKSFQLRKFKEEKGLKFEYVPD